MRQVWQIENNIGDQRNGHDMDFLILIGFCLGVLACYPLRAFFNWITPPEKREARRIVFWGVVFAISLFFLIGLFLGRSF